MLCRDPPLPPLHISQRLLPFGLKWQCYNIKGSWLFKCSTMMCESDLWKYFKSRENTPIWYQDGLLKALAKQPPPPLIFPTPITMSITTNMSPFYMPVFTINTWSAILIVSFLFKSEYICYKQLTPMGQSAQCPTLNFFSTSPNIENAWITFLK